MRCAKCEREATRTHPQTGAALCGRHGKVFTDAVNILMTNADQMVTHLAAGYLPEMRSHDASVLQRVMDTIVSDDDRFELKLHLAARKVAAHIVLEERSATIVA